jgi:hypothetical protein
MALVAMSRSPSLLVSYLETYLGRLEYWLRDWRIAVNVSNSAALLLVKTARHVQNPRAVQFFGKPIQWVETARYLWIILDSHLTWSSHVNQMGKAAERLGVLSPLFDRKSGLSVRNSVLLYKQLIRLMMDYAFPTWRSAAFSHVRKLQVLRSKCLRIATNAPWCVSNRQIHEDLGNSFFADHIRALTEFRLKVS